MNFKAKSVGDLLWMLLGVFALTIIIGLWYAFAFEKLWGWFVTPLGVPDLTLGMAYGIMILVNFLKYKYTDAEVANASKEKIIKVCTNWLIYPAFAIGLGYLVHLVIT